MSTIGADQFESKGTHCPGNPFPTESRHPPGQVVEIRAIHAAGLPVGPPHIFVMDEVFDPIEKPPETRNSPWNEWCSLSDPGDEH